MKQLRDLDILDIYISLREEIDDIKQNNAQLEQELAELKQSQKQLAIDELEKVIDYIRNAEQEPRYWNIASLIGSQIKELKGEEQ